jgi:hypothetical protein
MGMFSSQNSNSGGFRRASLGTLLIVGGAIAGICVGMPMLHQSYTVTQTPVSMSCVELLRDGIPPETSMVSLIDAQVHLPGKVEIGLEGQADSAALAKVQALLALPQAQPLVDRMVRGDVLPRGMTKRPGPQPLRLSAGRDTAETAAEEVLQTGELFVHVSADLTAKLILQASQALQLPVPDRLQLAADIPAYTLQPASLILPRQDAFMWVGGGALALVLGWILCGSCSLGWWAFFSPISALLCLPGFPLRRGRGNRTIWLLTLVAGVAGLAGAHYLMMTRGHFGQSNGIWIWQSAGLLVGTFAVATIAGTVLSIRAKQRPELSDDPFASMAPSAKKKKFKGGRSRKFDDVDAEAEALLRAKPAQLQSMLATNDYARRYLDPRLSVSVNMQTSAAVQAQTESLERLQFDAPLIIEFSRGEDTIEATVQVGCRNLVMAMTDSLNDDLRLRMVSMLEDGHVVISGNGEDERLTTALNGESTSLRVFPTMQAAKLVTKHLEEAADIAQHRRTKMVLLDPSEWRDVIHYSERCMADTLHHAHLEKWDIADAHYGRFSFPPREVTSPVMMM